jgi:hypothetical protein
MGGVECSRRRRRSNGNKGVPLATRDTTPTVGRVCRVKGRMGKPAVANESAKTGQLNLRLYVYQDWSGHGCSNRIHSNDVEMC